MSAEKPKSLLPWKAKRVLSAVWRQEITELHGKPVFVYFYEHQLPDANVVHVIGDIPGDEIDKNETNVKTLSSYADQRDVETKLRERGVKGHFVFWQDHHLKALRTNAGKLSKKDVDGLTREDALSRLASFAPKPELDAVLHASLHVGGTAPAVADAPISSARFETPMPTGYVPPNRKLLRAIRERAAVPFQALASRVKNAGKRARDRLAAVREARRAKKAERDARTPEGRARAWGERVLELSGPKWNRTLRVRKAPDRFGTLGKPVIVSFPNPIGFGPSVGEVASAHLPVLLDAHRTRKGLRVFAYGYALPVTGRSEKKSEDGVPLDSPRHLIPIPDGHVPFLHAALRQKHPGAEIRIHTNDETHAFHPRGGASVERFGLTELFKRLALG